MACLLTAGCARGPGPAASTASAPRWPVTLLWDRQVLLGTIVHDRATLRALLDKALADGVPCKAEPPDVPVKLFLDVGPDGRTDPLGRRPDRGWPGTAWERCIADVLAPLSYPPPTHGSSLWVAAVPVLAAPR